MNSLLLNPQSRKQLEHLLEHWPQVVVIHGPDAIGKKTAIKKLISERHPDKSEQISNGSYAQLQVISSKKDRKTIGVDQIRELNQFLTLTDDQTRYILIDEAERLTIPAQNAFLKNLEQPQSDVYIVLITTDVDRLLPTIRSRAQHIRVQAPSLDNLSTWAKEKFDTEFDPALIHVAKGSPGRLSQLLSDSDKSAQVAEEVTQAKQILQASVASRLAMISKLKNDRAKSERIITHIKVMSRGAMRRVEIDQDIHDWANRAEHSEHALDALGQSANLRLVWLRLMINL